MKADTLGYDHSLYRTTLAIKQDMAADFMRVQDHWSTGHSDSAFSLLDSMVTQYNIDTLNDSSYITFKALLNFQDDLRRDSLSIFGLDSSHIVTLNSIAVNGRGQAARSARAALHFFYGYPYETHLQLPAIVYGDETRALRAVLPSNTDSTITAKDSVNYLTAYPNPTAGLEYFNFKLPCSNSEGLLIVADMAGHTMFSMLLNSEITSVIVNVNSWSNSTYLYRLTCNDKIVGTGKFEVIK
jgi:hypothetical protein